MPPTFAAASARKLPKQERREQLLDCAQVMVREEGTEALTLARVAERAGVTKPVAYDHFGTREVLMVELFRRIDDKQTALLVDTLKTTAGRLDAIAATIAAAYMSCALEVGAEWYALSAALKGSEAMEAVQRELVSRYVGIWQGAFAPHADHLPPDEPTCAAPPSSARPRRSRSNYCAAISTKGGPRRPWRRWSRRRSALRSRQRRADLPKKQASLAKVLGNRPLSEGERMRIGYLK